MLDRLLINIGHVAKNYVIVVGVFAALWLWWRYRPGGRRPLQAKPIGLPQVRREVLTSIVSIVVIGSVMPVTFALGLGRHAHFYQSVHAYGRGWGFIAAMVLLMMVIQDTWFYWTHRLMHHRRLFRRFQRQPAQRGRTIEAQLHRFFGTTSGRKEQYARVLTSALAADRLPDALRGVLGA